MRKVLIANRGEIAVRVARACRDAGLTAIAVYADQDRNAPYVRLADEAYALGGALPAHTYLDRGLLVQVALRVGADAVHPGYGFLSEEADFAQAVVEAGLTWIGPPPAVIRLLGSKVRAHELARAAGGELARNAAVPVTTPEDVAAFAAAHGLPIVIKAVHGGGGRGIRVVHRVEEIPDQLAAAAREGGAAFGRSECCVMRYVERARHVETQCLADRRGEVAVLGTRDCSLQRRRQKLVEEAPAPFLPPGLAAELRDASAAILSRAGYVGAGTCEFLVGPDGRVQFLEVNARLQVEHPVTEEVTGVDVVREQLRIAGGGLVADLEPAVRGHAIEFRINAEDAGRGFLPAAGQVRLWRPPQGPGVRVDGAVEEGSVVDSAFDSLLAKLVVNGASRREAIERSRRALAEFEVEGVPTLLPFYRRLLREPAFAEPSEGFAIHTRWVETELPPGFTQPAAPPTEGPQVEERERVVVEVDGRRFEVTVPARSGARRPGVERRWRPPRPRSSGAARGASGNVLASPMHGLVVRVAVENGSRVASGDPVVVLEAMKMEQPVVAHRDGVISDLAAAAGRTIERDAPICRIVD